MREGIAVYKGLVIGGDGGVEKVGTGGEGEVPKYLSSFYHVSDARPDICMLSFYKLPFLNLRKWPL